MKRLIVTTSALILSACAASTSKTFMEPTTGPIAYVKADAQLKGMFYMGKRTSLYVYNPCTSTDNTSNDLGSVEFQESEFNQKVVAVPANRRVFMRYGTDYKEWNCKSAFSFIPEQSKQYLIGYQIAYGNCYVSVTTPDGSEANALQFYKDYKQNKWGNACTSP
jgi:hypothetical protein